MTEHIRNREGQRLELGVLSGVDEHDESWTVHIKDSWSLIFNKSESGDFIPREGDWILISNEGFNTVAGIIIEGRVIRAKTSAECKDDHQRWLNEHRLQKLEAYIKHGDELKARVADLPKPLRERMERFADEDGVEFWIDSAPYEMAGVSGAAALLRKVCELGYIDNVDEGYFAGDHLGAIQWIEDWWDLNTEKHNYDYKRQMEMVPDFGEGHSGWTASAARGLAIAILNGDSV